MDMDLHDEIEHSLGAEAPLVETDLVGRDGERCGGVVSRQVGRWSRSPRSPSSLQRSRTARPPRSRPAGRRRADRRHHERTVVPPRRALPVIRDPRMPSDAPVGLEPDGLHLAPGIGWSRTGTTLAGPPGRVVGRARLRRS